MDLTLNTSWLSVRLKVYKMPFIVFGGAHSSSFSLYTATVSLTPPIPIMPETFTYEFDTTVYKGKTSFSTGLFINGKFVDGSEGGLIE